MWKRFAGLTGDLMVIWALVLVTHIYLPSRRSRLIQMKESAPVGNLTIHLDRTWQV